MLGFTTIIFIVLSLLAIIGQVTSCVPVESIPPVLSHVKTTSIHALETPGNYDSLSVFYVDPKNKHTSIQSKFKEESMKTSYFDISLLETDVRNSSSSGINETYIVPFGFQSTLYEIAPVKKNSINNGFMSSTTACQSRNVDGNGEHLYCLVTFTYTAKDSFNSSITFMVAYSQYSTNVWKSTNVYRTVSTDGIYFGKTFNVQLSETTIGSTTKYNFRFKEVLVKKSDDNQIEPMVAHTLSAKESNPSSYSSYTLDVSHAVRESYMTPAGIYEVTGNISYFDSAAATYDFTVPLYDNNGKFFGIYLSDQSFINVVPDDELPNKVNYHKVKGDTRKLQAFSTLPGEVTQAVNTIILNDIAASSITFIETVPNSNSLIFKYISVASSGIFFGKKYEIVIVHDSLTFELVTITITEIKNKKSSSFMIENNFVETEQSEVSRGLKKKDDDYKKYSWPSFQVSWNPSSMNGAFFNTLARDLQRIEGEPITNYYSYMQTINGDTIQITYICQYVNDIYDIVICQTMMTYMVGGGGDSSISFVTSLFGEINFVPCTPVNKLELFPVDKIVKSVSGTGIYFGRTYNVRIVANVVDGVGSGTLISLSLTFTDTVPATLKPTSKPSKKPVKKPAKKPDDKQSVNLGSSSTGTSESSVTVGAIVGITVGAFLIICLLIFAYFWYMKKKNILQLESQIVPLSQFI